MISIGKRNFTNFKKYIAFTEKICKKEMTMTITK